MCPGGTSIRATLRWEVVWQASLRASRRLSIIRLLRSSLLPQVIFQVAEDLAEDSLVAEAVASEAVVASAKAACAGASSMQEVCLSKPLVYQERFTPQR